MRRGRRTQRINGHNLWIFFDWRFHFSYFEQVTFQKFLLWVMCWLDCTKNENNLLSKKLCFLSKCPLLYECVQHSRNCFNQNLNAYSNFVVSYQLWKLRKVFWHNLLAPWSRLTRSPDQLFAINFRHCTSNTRPTVLNECFRSESCLSLSALLATVTAPSLLIWCKQPNRRVVGVSSAWRFSPYCTATIPTVAAGRTRPEVSENLPTLLFVYHHFERALQHVNPEGK